MQVAVQREHLQEWDHAAVAYKQGQAVAQRALGPAHPSTLTAAGNLAQLLYDQAKWDEAEPLFLRALSGEEDNPSWRAAYSECRSANM